MRRIIKVTKEESAFLEKAFNVTARMVAYALTFDPTRGQSDLAKRIRTLALQRGGKIMNILPVCETLHDSDGHMRQYFGMDIVLDLNKENGLVVLLDKGVQVAAWDDPLVSEFESIQAIAMGMVVRG